MSTFSKHLRALEGEFLWDRNYGTSERREEFRGQVAEGLRVAADVIERHEAEMFRQGDKLEMAWAENERLAGILSRFNEVDDLEFTNRTRNVLLTNRIYTVEQIARTPDVELKRLQNFGRKSFNEVRARVPYVPEGKPRVRVQAAMGAH